MGCGGAHLTEHCARLDPVGPLLVDEYAQPVYMLRVLARHALLHSEGADHALWRTRTAGMLRRERLPTLSGCPLRTIGRGI